MIKNTKALGFTIFLTFKVFYTSKDDAICTFCCISKNSASNTGEVWMTDIIKVYQTCVRVDWSVLKCYLHPVNVCGSSYRVIIGTQTRFNILSHKLQLNTLVHGTCTTLEFICIWYADIHGHINFKCFFFFKKNKKKEKKIL